MSWWHPRSGQLGDGENPYPADECMLSPSRAALERMRIRFEQLCRNGRYGPEWQDIALGRKSWVQVTP